MQLNHHGVCKRKPWHFPPPLLYSLDSLTQETLVLYGLLYKTILC